MRSRLGLTLLLAAMQVAPAAAQWSFGPEVGIQSFSPSARDTVAGADLGPARATMLGLWFARTGARMDIELRLRYGRSGLAATNGDITVIQERVFTMYDISSTASWRLVRLGDATTLRVAAGPALSIWKAKGGERRTRVGATAGLQLRVALSARYHFSVRAEAGVHPSVFDQSDLIADTERRTAWRRSAAFALGRTL